MTNQNLLSPLQNHQNLSSHREAIVSANYIPQQIISHNLKAFLSQNSTSNQDPTIIQNNNTSNQNHQSNQKTDNIAAQLIMNNSTSNPSTTNSAAGGFSLNSNQQQRNVQIFGENNNNTFGNSHPVNDPKLINKNIENSVNSKPYLNPQEQQLFQEQQHIQSQQIYLLQQQQQQQLQNSWMMQAINTIYSDNAISNNFAKPIAQKFTNEPNNNFSANPLVDSISGFNIPQYKKDLTSGTQNDSNPSSSTAHLNSEFDLQASITNEPGPLDVIPNPVSNMKDIQEVDENVNTDDQKITENTNEVASKPESNAYSFLNNSCVINSSSAGLPHVITNKKDNQINNANQQACFIQNLNQISYVNPNLMFSNSMMSSMIGNNFDIAPPPSHPPLSSSSSFSGISPDTLDQPFLEALTTHNSPFSSTADNSNHELKNQQQKNPQVLPGSTQQSFFQMNNGSSDKNTIPNNYFNFQNSSHTMVPPSQVITTGNANMNSNTGIAAQTYTPTLYFPQNLIVLNNKQSNAPSSAGSDFSSIDTISPTSDRSSFGMLPQYTGGKSKKQHRRRNTDPSSSSVARLQLLANNVSALHTNNDGRGSFSSMSSVSSSSPTSTILNSEIIPGKSNYSIVDGNNIPILTSSVPSTRGNNSVQMTVPETSSISFNSNGRSMSFTDAGSVKRVNNVNFMTSTQNHVNISSDSGNSIIKISDGSSKLVPGNHGTQNFTNVKISTNSGNPIIHTSSNTGSIENISNVVPKPKNFCPHCNKSFKRPSSLQTHIYTHTGEKPFVCTKPGCNKWFSVRSNMIRHAKLHERDNNKDTNKFSN